jgi:uncharacterized protein (DUF433 family)
MDGHIVVDDKGVARVGKTQMKVLQLVQEIQSEGLTAEQAAEAFPVTVADAHAALAYYYDHPDEMNAQQRATEELIHKNKLLFPNQLTRADLEARMRQQEQQP